MRRMAFTVRAWHAWLEERAGSVFSAKVKTNHEAFKMAHWLEAQGSRVRVTGPDGNAALEPATPIVKTATEK